jgi:hypothetical protein
VSGKHARRRHVWPLPGAGLVAGLIVAAACALAQQGDPCTGVGVAADSQAATAAVLIQAGWSGRAFDGEERLYPAGCATR